MPDCDAYNFVTNNSAFVLTLIGLVGTGIRVSGVSYVYTEIKVQQYQMLLYIMREKCVERTSNNRTSSFISRLTLPCCKAIATISSR